MNNRRRISALRHLSQMAASLTAVLVGCVGSAVGRDEVPGTYVLSSTDVTDTLVLHINGTYAHRAYVHGTLIVADSSGWTYPSDVNGGVEHRAEFRNFSMARLSRMHPDPHPAWWMPYVEHDFRGRVRLVIDPDVALYYDHI